MTNAVSDVTVIIPTRDRPQLLKQAIASVLAQTEVSVHVIVVDDGSNVPVTVPVDNRIELVRHAYSEGVAAARNTGILHVKSPFTAFCDDDDLWFENKLSHQINTLGDRVWSVCSSLVQGPDGTLRAVEKSPVENLDAELHHSNVVPGGGSGVLVRSEVLRSTGGFDVSLSVFADWRMWQLLSTEGDPAVIAEPLLIQREHATQMAVDPDDAIAELELLIAAGIVAPDQSTTRSWIYHRSKRGGFTNRIGALRSSWRGLNFRSKIRLIASALQPASIRKARERATGQAGVGNRDIAELSQSQFASNAVGIGE